MQMWDLYDENLSKTNLIIKETEKIPSGLYHIALEIWIINDKKEVLILKRSLDYTKIYPGSWCCLGGNLQSNVPVDMCINKITKFKTGITLDLKNSQIKNPIKRDPYQYAYQTCIIYSNVDIETLCLNTDHFTKAKYVNKEELIKMCNNGEVAYYLIDRIKKEILPLMK